MALVRKASPEDLAARAKAGLVPPELWSNLPPGALAGLPPEVLAALPEEARQRAATADGDATGAAGSRRQPNG